MGKKKAQSILEFTFAMIVALFFIYGLMQTVQWTLLTTADQSQGQEVGGGSPGSALGVNAKPARPIRAIWQPK